VDPTAAGTTRITITLQVTSSFTATTDASGSCATNAAERAGHITADAAGDRLFLTYTAILTSNVLEGCTFTYQVL